MERSTGILKFIRYDGLAVAARGNDLAIVLISNVLGVSNLLHRAHFQLDAGASVLPISPFSV